MIHGTYKSEYGTYKTVKARFRPRLEPFPVRKSLKLIQVFSLRSEADCELLRVHLRRGNNLKCIKYFHLKKNYHTTEYFHLNRKLLHNCFNTTCKNKLRSKLHCHIWTWCSVARIWSVCVSRATATRSNLCFFQRSILERLY